jgi:ribonuclease P protein component
VKRQFRLTKSSDYKRVRQLGKSYAHPLLVLVAAHTGQEASQFAVSASRTVGGAVERNRAKRLVREALRPWLPAIASGWQVVMLCRRSAGQAKYHEMQDAVHSLLVRARLLKDSHDSSATIT